MNYMIFFFLGPARLRAATIKEFDTIVRVVWQFIAIYSNVLAIFYVLLRQFSFFFFENMRFDVYRNMLIESK